MSWRRRLDELVDELTPEIVALRRRLHANPEPSGEELETSLWLYQLFSSRELPVRMGPEGRGLLVDSRHQGADRRVALRADIDALRIQDAKQTDYRSTRPGVMHACGHDAHTACLYGAAMAMDTLAQEGAAPGDLTWRAIFQPSEETAQGAAEMVAAGAVEQVDALFSLHVDPSRQTGAIGVRPGVFTANCDDVQFTIHGRGGHAARPHESKDPIAAAALLISTLYQYVPRATDSQDAVVVTIGRVNGGDNANVIPERVELAGTLRTLDQAVRERTIANIRQVAAGVQEITRTKIEIRFDASIPSVMNDRALTEIVSTEGADLLGESHVAGMPRASMGSEDFAVYSEHTRTAMFRLGVADVPPAPGLHTPMFDVDERALAIGAKLLARSAIAFACRA